MRIPFFTRCISTIIIGGKQGEITRWLYLPANLRLICPN